MVTEVIQLLQGEEPPPTTWWARYESRLSEGGISKTARTVIEADSEYVVQAGILGAGPWGEGPWPDGRFRSGLVMGAVQSGKTASMLGVTAKSLDIPLDVVVILAGTRLALWRQAYDRIYRQLFVDNPDDGILLPEPRTMEQGAPRGALGAMFNLPTARVRRALKECQPLVLTVMKHGQHIRAASKFLHERVYTNLGLIDRPVHLLVLDDEADDGSILDALVESAADPAVDQLKQIPRHVVDLWSRRQVAPATAHPLLHATYVAYTATPQANFLQADQNPLAPRDFIASLRTPSDSGEIAPRSTTYREPQGLRSFYTGGEAFYHRINGPGSLIASDLSTSDAGQEQDAVEGRQAWIAQAVRAWLVAAAIRLDRAPGNRRYAGLHEQHSETREGIEAKCPLPHTMLIHPSATVDDHFEALAEALGWAHGISMDEARSAAEEGLRDLAVDALREDMEEHPALWVHWLHEYGLSATAVAAAYGLEDPPTVPPEGDWARLKDILLEDIVPHVRLSVVNSDPDADDRPRFTPYLAGEFWHAPPDLLTIFISGNVMARGLTLEGLTSTLFLRSSNDPTADVQMQMQRWFGYRGSYLELCRVFLSTGQALLFEKYQDADEALRRQVLAAMNAAGVGAPSPLVLEGLDFRATGKIEGVSKVPLCPGATPFMDLVNVGAEPDPNVDVLVEAFQRPSSDVTAVGKVRGRILDEPLDLVEAAALLERLTYYQYTPDLTNPLSTRWQQLEDQLGLSADLGEQYGHLFRPPTEPTEESPSVIPPARCPYSVAAYLRLWNACLSRHAVGLFPTDDPDGRWSLLDLDKRRDMQPKFYVGLRYGSESPFKSTDPGAAALEGLDFEPHPMSRKVHEGLITSTWGTRNPGDDPDAYLGDQLFDYHYHHSDLLPKDRTGGPLWRPLGAPGLLLFHLIRTQGEDLPVVALGAAIPLGGPDHFAARPRR